MSAKKRHGWGKLLSFLLAGLGWCWLAVPARAELVLQGVYSSTASSAAMPFSELVQAGDGNFYGTVRGNNYNSFGSIFRLTPAGTLTTLVTFYGGNGKNPEGGLLLARDGNLYGTTYTGGAHNLGILFRLTPAGVFQILRAFSGTDGASPTGTLIQANDGLLYGVTAGYLTNPAAIFRATTGGTVTILTNLESALPAAGAMPGDGLVQGPDGWLYGTARISSAGKTRELIGAIYKVSTNGTFQTLAWFRDPLGTPLPGGIGDRPIGGLTAGPDGFLYGTLGHTIQLSLSYPATNHGTVFQMTTNGVMTTLVRFAGTNGSNPMTRLLLARDGAFYGLTAEGGATDNGTLFRVTTNGVLTKLIDGVGGDDADRGPGPLIQAADGNFYGTGWGRAPWVSSGTPSAAFVYRLVSPPAMTGQTMASSRVALTWSSFPQASYQVAYKDSAEATNWTSLGSPIVATGTTTSVSFGLSEVPQRFYRVVLLP
ncbi:MAG TPA: choice-of-anchor tandem repeat GloVer-containing protein [Bacillota bacterium]|nr:choice-of-anchor tandem repeat GloVer-containing protein [Bacillota bacterium]